MIPLIDTDDKLPDYITLKNAMILATWLWYQQHVNNMLKMLVNFMHKYFYKKHCKIDEELMLGACPETRNKK